MISCSLSLLCCCAFAALLAAPVHEFSGEAGLFMEDPELRLALKLGQAVAMKVIDDIPAAHKATVSSQTLSLNSPLERKLEYMVTLLKIPAPPVLQAIGADFTLETCLNNMSEGLQMYQDLLAVISGRVETPENLAEMQADLKELLGRVHKIRKLSELEMAVPHRMSDLATRLTGDFEVEVATHLVLVELRTFVQHVFRGLRNISQMKPGLRV
ncbi:colony stimulating factor 3 (granulocyte) a [Scleropages formosus]|uniref:Granulocyte colony-stimulating factor-like n=1 Tax=Scleropages formosus TaxID=113540 RepID=A0A8C9R775_SCLFO|nr:uncharacterized protein LOC108928176 [Scleropages formosus]